MITEFPLLVFTVLTGIAAGAIFAAAGAIVAYVASSKKLGRTAATAAFVLLAVALVVSRYGFYMASII